MKRTDLIRAREHLGCQRAQFADKIGVDRTIVYKVESRHPGAPGPPSCAVGSMRSAPASRSTSSSRRLRPTHCRRRSNRRPDPMGRRRQERACAIGDGQSSCCGRPLALARQAQHPGRRIPNARAFGQPGLTRGLPDLLVLGPSLPVGFIELKRDQRSVISDDQRLFARLCLELGVRHAYAVGRDEPIAVLEAWDIVRRAAA